MSRLADSDGPSWKQRVRRREADLAFLDRVRAYRADGNVPALTQMMADHRRAPEWKRIAINRALASALSRTKGEK